MKIGNSTLRGGQTVFHGIRMWGQLLRAGLFLAAAATVAVPAWHAWRNTTGYEWYAAAMVTVAEMKLAIGYRKDSGQEIRLQDGSTTVLTITEIAASPRALVLRERLKDEIYASAFLGLRFGVLAIGLFLGRLLAPRPATEPEEKNPGGGTGDAEDSSAARFFRLMVSAPVWVMRCPCPSVQVVQGPTASRTCRTPSGPRPSTPSSPAPPVPARRC